MRAIGRLKLTQLTDAEVEAGLLRPMAAAGLSHATIERARAVLRSSFKRAHAARVVVQDAKVPKSAPHTKPTPSLGKADIDAIVAALEGNTLQPIVVTAAYLGLRNAEVRALQWRDIDFTRGAVRIAAQLNRDRERVARKSDAGTRELPLPANVQQALENIRKEQLACGEVSDWETPCRRATPLSGENLPH